MNGQSGPRAERVGVLTKEYAARLLNCSHSGCLVETNTRMEVGTIGSLCFVIEGAEYTDDIQVVRCQPIEGAGALYRVGVRFLWTVPRGKRLLRHRFGFTTQPEGARP